MILADDEGDWKDMKQESKKMKLDETAEEALQALFAEHPKAKDLYDMSFGWAVFDNLKLAFGISGGGGNGVAKAKESGEKTYMKMGTAGVGFGLGVNKYQVIFLFQDSKTYDNFVNKGWQADAGATASAGKNAAEVKDQLRKRPGHLSDDRKGPDGKRRHRRHQILEEQQAQLGACQENIMKKHLALAAAIAATFLISPTNSSLAAEESWQSLKRESKRMKIDETAQGAQDRLFAKSPKAKDLYDISYGWAVFDNLKLAFGFSGGGGNGVAKAREAGEKTYMQMGTAGIGIGLGINKYQVVFLFQDSTTFKNFVNKGWQADAGATASAGKNAAEVKTGFVNGIAIYQMTERGLMANADIAGTKYWKNKKLNK